MQAFPNWLNQLDSIHVPFGAIQARAGQNGEWSGARDLFEPLIGDKFPNRWKLLQIREPASKNQTDHSFVRSAAGSFSTEKWT
jgi:hypothetical protein